MIRRHKIRRRPWLAPPAGGWLLLGLVGFFVSGCAGYRLGPTNGLQAGDKSIEIVPFPNRTLQPRLSDAVNSEVRKQVQRNGTYKLATRGDGDIVLTGVILKYDRAELTFVPSDILTVQDYRLGLTVQVTARERASGKVILDQPVTGVTLMRVTSDMASAERQALPLLAADLARNVADLLADGKW